MPNLPIKRAIFGKSATTGVSSPSNTPEGKQQPSYEEFNFNNNEQPALNSPTRVKSSLSNPPPVMSSPREKQQPSGADGNDTNGPSTPVNPLATSPRRKPQLLHQKAKTELGYSPSGKPRPVTSPRPRETSNAASSSPRAKQDREANKKQQQQQEDANDLTSPRESLPESAGDATAVWDEKLDELISDFGGTATNSKFERAMRKTIVCLISPSLSFLTLSFTMRKRIWLIWVRNLS